MRFKTTTVMLAACAALWLQPAHAQTGQPGNVRHGGPGGSGFRPPIPPIEIALDVDGDEIIGAAEIAAAATSLATLDADGDGGLSMEESLPPRPDGGGRREPPAGAPPRPAPPVLQALDTNDDGTVDGAEVAGAPTALLSLDRNQDGRLTTDEYRPPRPGS